jgi:hypothetical protein
MPAEEAVLGDELMRNRVAFSPVKAVLTAE